MGSSQNWSSSAREGWSGQATRVSRRGCSTSTAASGSPCSGDGRNLVDLTAVENVALAIRLALGHPDAHGQAYNITNGDPRPFRELLDLLFGLLGETPRYRRVSTRVLYPLAGALERICAALPGKPEPPLTRYTLTTIAYSQTLDITRAKNDLGYAPRVSLDDALAAFAATRGAA